MEAEKEAWKNPQTQLFSSFAFGGFWMETGEVVQSKVSGKDQKQP